MFSRTKNYYKGIKSDHFDGKRFFNPWNPARLSFLSFLRWRMTAKPKPWPKYKENLTDIPPEKIEGSNLRVSYVGHSTVLLQTKGLNILTDPIWSDRASPVKWMGPKRITKPGIPFEKLPKIDIVLVSHNHYDHMDMTTLRRLWKKDQPRFITPLGNDTIIRRYIPSATIDSLDWGQSIPINDHVTIYLEPVQHWSGRSLVDRFKALWGAFIIDTTAGKIYFAGDTGYGMGEHCKLAKKKHGSFRFSMLPIGTYQPRWFMNYPHMNPEEAVLTHKDLGEPYTMGMHYGTFHLSDEGYEDPINDLAKAREKFHVPKERFRTLSIGEAWNIPEEKI